jgi:hypothetical protein
LLCTLVILILVLVLELLLVAASPGDGTLLVRMVRLLRLIPVESVLLIAGQVVLELCKVLGFYDVRLRQGVDGALGSGLRALEVLAVVDKVLGDQDARAPVLPTPREVRLRKDLVYLRGVSVICTFALAEASAHLTTDKCQL